MGILRSPVNLVVYIRCGSIILSLKSRDGFKTGLRMTSTLPPGFPPPGNSYHKERTLFPQIKDSNRTRPTQGHIPSHIEVRVPPERRCDLGTAVFPNVYESVSG